MEASNYTGPIEAFKKLEIAPTFLGKFYYFFPLIILIRAL